MPAGRQQQQPALSPEEFLEVFLPLWHAYKQAGPPPATVVSYYEVLKGVPRDVLERRSLEWRKTGKKMPTAAEWLGKA